jgi:hypothetical protein
MEAEGEASFDELHGALEREIFGGCDERVEVIGHDHEVVQEIFVLGAVMKHGVDEKSGGGFASKESLALMGDGSDEEGTIHR